MLDKRRESPSGSLTGFWPSLNKTAVGKQSGWLEKSKKILLSQPGGRTKNMKTKTLAGLAAIALSLIATVGWSCGQGYGVSNIEPTDASTDVPDDWQTYRNVELDFEFRHPTDLDVHVETVRISDAPETADANNPWLLTQHDLADERSAIASVPVGQDSSFRGNQLTRSYFEKIVALPGSLKAKWYLGTDEGGGLFSSYVFYRRDHRVEIWVSRDLPESVYVDGVADNLLFNELLEQIEQGTAAEDVQRVFDDFDRAVQSLRFTE